MFSDRDRSHRAVGRPRIAVEGGEGLLRPGLPPLLPHRASHHPRQEPGTGMTVKISFKKQIPDKVNQSGLKA